MFKDMGPVSQKILSPLMILSREKTMVTKVISELKSLSRLKIPPETGPWFTPAGIHRQIFGLAQLIGLGWRGRGYAGCTPPTEI